ncbi:MAG: hypothetical protein BJ554DRAFT_4481 [Olpidium bornovanus]|uniref:Uncharacterized protein n=1 Tax=Olpidium bornovanus TaxID=278681 RepID=A0A8H8DEX1_9FUNG|nr:MAG: hypothetical protein BJ554DRAFT_4481 [Olpidium bornovanus]
MGCNPDNLLTRSQPATACPILEKSVVATKKTSSTVGKLKTSAAPTVDADDDLTFEELDEQPSTAAAEEKPRASLKTQNKRPAKKDFAPNKRNRTESGSRSVRGVSSEEDRPHKAPSSAKLQKALTHDATRKSEPAELGEEHSEKKRSSYTAFLNRSGPTAPGSKEIPEGAEDCLAVGARCARPNEWRPFA